MALTLEQRKRFNRLKDVLSGYPGYGDPALMECRRKSDGRVVALVVEMRDRGTTVESYPLAEVLLDGSIDEYDPPNSEEPDGFGGIPVAGEPETPEEA